MKKYQVIIVLDETRERSYFYSYVISEDSTKGNIECTELPPYADIDKARACYWKNGAWIFDEEKYTEILAKIEAEKEAIQAEADRIASIPSNEELNLMVLTAMEGLAEVMVVIDDVVKPLTELASLLK